MSGLDVYDVWGGSYVKNYVEMGVSNGNGMRDELVTELIHVPGIGWLADQG